MQKATLVFYIEEVQESLLENFPNLPNISVATICRALHHDLKISQNVRARESMPLQLKEYYYELGTLYGYPEQLIFLTRPVRTEETH